MPETGLQPRDEQLPHTVTNTTQSMRKVLQSFNQIELPPPASSHGLSKRRRNLPRTCPSINGIKALVSTKTRKKCFRVQTFGLVCLCVQASEALVGSSQWRHRIMHHYPFLVPRYVGHATHITHRGAKKKIYCTGREMPCLLPDHPLNSYIIIRTSILAGCMQCLE